MWAVLHYARNFWRQLQVPGQRPQVANAEQLLRLCDLEQQHHHRRACAEHGAANVTLAQRLLEHRLPHAMQCALRCRIQ